MTTITKVNTRIGRKIKPNDKNYKSKYENW